jgi:transposase
MQEHTEVDILADLDELDKAIIRMKLDGHKNTEIATSLQKSRQTIDNRFKKFKVQQAVKELQKEAIEILIDTQSKAARELRRIIESKTAMDSDKIRAAREVLKGVLSDKINLTGDINIVYADKQDEDL